MESSDTSPTRSISSVSSVESTPTHVVQRRSTTPGTKHPRLLFDEEELSDPIQPDAPLPTSFTPSTSAIATSSSLPTSSAADLLGLSYGPESTLRVRLSGLRERLESSEATTRAYSQRIEEQADELKQLRDLNAEQYLQLKDAHDHIQYLTELRLQPGSGQTSSGSSAASLPSSVSGGLDLSTLRGRALEQQSLEMIKLHQHISAQSTEIANLQNVLKQSEMSKDSRIMAQQIELERLRKELSHLEVLHRTSENQESRLMETNHHITIETQQTITTLQLEVTELKLELNSTKQEFDELIQRSEQIKLALEKSEANLSESIDDYNKLLTEYERIRLELTHYHTEVDEARNTQLNTSGQQNTIDQLRLKYEDEMHRLNEVHQNELKLLQTQLNQYEQQIRTLNHELLTQQQSTSTTPSQPLQSNSELQAQCEQFLIEIARLNELIISQNRTISDLIASAPGPVTATNQSSNITTKSELSDFEQFRQTLNLEPQPTKATPIDFTTDDALSQQLQQLRVDYESEVTRLQQVHQHELNSLKLVLDATSQELNDVTHRTEQIKAALEKSEANLSESIDDYNKLLNEYERIRTELIHYQTKEEEYHHSGEATQQLHSSADPPSSSLSSNSTFNHAPSATIPSSPPLSSTTPIGPTASGALDLSDSDWTDLSWLVQAHPAAFSIAEPSTAPPNLASSPGVSTIIQASDPSQSPTTTLVSSSALQIAMQHYLGRWLNQYELNVIGTMQKFIQKQRTSTSVETISQQDLLTFDVLQKVISNLHQLLCQNSKIAVIDPLPSFAQALGLAAAGSDNVHMSMDELLAHLNTWSSVLPESIHELRTMFGGGIFHSRVLLKLLIEYQKLTITHTQLQKEYSLLTASSQNLDSSHANSSDQIPFLQNRIDLLMSEKLALEQELTHSQEELATQNSSDKAVIQDLQTQLQQVQEESMHLRNELHQSQERQIQTEGELSLVSASENKLKEKLQSTEAAFKELQLKTNSNLSEDAALSRAPFAPNPPSVEFEPTTTADSFKSELVRLQTELSEVNQLLQLCQQRESELIATNRKQINESEATIAALHNEVSSLKSVVDLQTRQINEMTTRTNQIKVALEKSEANLSESIDDYNKLLNEYERIRTELIQYQTKEEESGLVVPSSQNDTNPSHTTELVGQISILQRRIEVLLADKLAVEQELIRSNEQLAAQSSDKSTIENLHAAELQQQMRDESMNLRQELQLVKTTQLTTEEELSQATAELTKLQAKLQATETSFKELQLQTNAKIAEDAQRLRATADQNHQLEQRCQDLIERGQIYYRRLVQVDGIGDLEPMVPTEIESDGLGSVQQSQLSQSMPPKASRAMRSELNDSLGAELDDSAGMEAMQRLEQQGVEIERLNQQLVAFTNRLSDKDREIERLHSELDGAHAAANSNEKGLDLGQPLTHPNRSLAPFEQHELEINQLHQQLMDQTTQLTALQNELNQKDSRIMTQQIELDRLRAELNHLEELHRASENAESRLMETNHHITIETQRTITSLQTELNQTKLQLDVTTHQLDDLRSKLTSDRGQSNYEVFKRPESDDSTRMELAHILNGTDPSSSTQDLDQTQRDQTMTQLRIKYDDEMNRFRTTSPIKLRGAAAIAAASNTNESDEKYPSFQPAARPPVTSITPMILPEGEFLKFPFFPRGPIMTPTKPVVKPEEREIRILHTTPNPHTERPTKTPTTANTPFTGLKPKPYSFTPKSIISGTKSASKSLKK